MHAGLGEEPVKSLLLLNERNGAAEYLRVVVRQVNALPTFHTDKTISLRDAQQRLILLGTARWTAHRQFEDRTCVDHAEIHRRKPYLTTARSRLSGSPSKEGHVAVHAIVVRALDGGGQHQLRP
jgi:hypothetical protein